MMERRQRLQRLLAIRRMGEEIERRHLQSALGSVAEVENALSQQEYAISDASEAASSALRSGNRSERLFAEVQAEVAGWNQMRLTPVLQSLRQEIASSTAAFLDRRREAEQIQQLVNNCRLELRLMEIRKAQAAADDWFLTRRIVERK